MLRGSSMIPQKTHHIQHEITDTLRNLKGFYVEHPLVPQRNA